MFVSFCTYFFADMTEKFILFCDTFEKGIFRMDIDTEEIQALDIMGIENPIGLSYNTDTGKV